MATKKQWKKRYKDLLKLYQDEHVHIIEFGRLELPVHTPQEGETPQLQAIPINKLQYKGHIYQKVRQRYAIPTGSGPTGHDETTSIPKPTTRHPQTSDDK